jgi:hypothetical protein
MTRNPKTVLTLAACLLLIAQARAWAADRKGSAGSPATVPATASAVSVTAAPIPLSAGAAAALSPTASPTPALQLKGRWGIGFDGIPGAATDTSIIPGLAQSNAAVLRYWVTDRLAWDGLVALDLNSFPDQASVTTDTLGSSYGFGTAIKLNVRRPTPWLLTQVIARATWASLEAKSTGGSTAGSSDTTTTFALGAGIGFEAFLPCWTYLSVEGSLLLDFVSSQTKANGTSSPSAVQNGSTLSFDGTGFTPINVAVHLYF